MAIKIGREGSLGIGIERTPGTSVTASKWIPFLTCTLHGTQEILEDEAARGIRERVGGAIAGPKRGEGDVEMLLDAMNAPYLIVPALGAVSTTAATTQAYTHTISVKSTNAPKTMTLIYDNGIASRVFTNGVINTFEIGVSDGLATLSASVLSKFPTTKTGTKSITGETILGFKDYNLYFTTTTNSTYTTLKAAVLANTATATKLSALSFRYNNNAEIQHVSGDEDVESVSMGQVEIEGDYTLFFEDTTERDIYEGLDKRAMIIQFKGATVDSTTEQIFIGLPRIHLRERPIDTAIAGFLTENPTYVAQYDTNTTQSLEILITNKESDSTKYEPV